MRKLLLLCILLTVFLGQAVLAQDADLELVTSSWRDVFSEDGLEKINRFIEAYPDWSEGYLMLAFYWQTHPNSADFAENALSSVETAKSIIGDDDLMLMEIEANIHFNLGNSAEAEAIFLELNNLNPLNKNPYRYLNLLYIEQNRLDAALAINHLAQRSYPLDLEFVRAEREIYELNGMAEHLAFADLLIEARDFWSDIEPEKSLDTLREATALAAESAVIGDFDEAIALYWLQHYARTWSVYENFSSYTKEADESTQQMLALMPDWDLAYLIEARLFVGIDDDESAMAKLNEAITRFPNSPELIFQRGQLFEDTGEIEAASADYWAYGQLKTIRHVDYSNFTLLNQSQRIPMGGGWQANYSFAAEEGADLSFLATEQPFNDYFVALLDEQERLLAADVYLDSLDEYDELALNLSIPADGNYSLRIISLDWNWFPTGIDIEITLE